MNPPHSRAANSNVAGIVCLDKLNSMAAEQRAYPRKESVSPDASAVVESHTNVSLARHPAGISLNTVAGAFFFSICSERVETSFNPVMDNASVKALWKPLTETGVPITSCNLQLGIGLDGICIQP